MSEKAGRLELELQRFQHALLRHEEEVPRLANAARISLSPQEAEEFEPKIRQVVDWFGQLQAVDLESIEPSLRAGTAAGSSLREDKPETFVNRDAIVEAVPSFDDPFIKVPRVLNKE